MALVVEREGQRVALCVQMGSVKDCTVQNNESGGGAVYKLHLIYCMEHLGTWASQLAGKLKDETRYH